MPQVCAGFVWGWQVVGGGVCEIALSGLGLGLGSGQGHLSPRQ